MFSNVFSFAIVPHIIVQVPSLSVLFFINKYFALEMKVVVVYNCCQVIFIFLDS